MDLPVSVIVILCVCVVAASLGIFTATIVMKSCWCRKRGRTTVLEPFYFSSKGPEKAYNEPAQSGGGRLPPPPLDGAPRRLWTDVGYTRRLPLPETRFTLHGNLNTVSSFLSMYIFLMIIFRTHFSVLVFVFLRCLYNLFSKITAISNEYAYYCSTCNLY